MNAEFLRHQINNSALLSACRLHCKVDATQYIIKSHRRTSLFQAKMLENRRWPGLRWRSL